MRNGLGKAYTSSPVFSLLVNGESSAGLIKKGIETRGSYFSVLIYNLHTGSYACTGERGYGEDDSMVKDVATFGGPICQSSRCSNIESITKQLQREHKTERDNEI